MLACSVKLPAAWDGSQATRALASVRTAVQSRALIAASMRLPSVSVGMSADVKLASWSRATGL